MLCRSPRIVRFSSRDVALAVAFFLISALVTTGKAADKISFDLTVHAGKIARNNSPVSVPFDLLGELNGDAVQLTDADGHRRRAQLTTPGLAASKSQAPKESPQPQRELHFILAQLDAGSAAHFHGTIGPASEAKPEPRRPRSSLHGTPSDGHVLLTYGDRKVLDYIAPTLDNSTPKLREQTYKPFHQLYDATGSRLVTKGAGGNDTHHRGLFYGFNKITYDDGRKHADLWQCLGDAFQSHESILASAAGPALARQCLAIDWHGEEKQVIAHEQREVTVFAVPGGTLLDFVSILKTADGPVHVEGDPHHSGFHFRADNEVATTTKKETYYLRPDGVGKLDATINWDSTPNDPRTSDQPWKGMCFVLGGKRYTAAILDRPDNPKPARWSERDYGRLVSTFVADVTADHPLVIRYRDSLHNGETTSSSGWRHWRTISTSR